MHSERHPFPFLAIAPAIAGVLLGCSAPAAAKQQQEDGNELTVAVGAGLFPTYEGSDDYKPVVGGIARGKVDGFAFFGRGTFFHVDLLRESDDQSWDFSIGPSVGARMNRTGRIKDARVSALGKLDTAWEVGGWAGIAKNGAITGPDDNVSVRVAYFKDIGGAHQSYVVSPSIEYATPLSRTTLFGISLSADYVGKGYGRVLGRYAASPIVRDAGNRNQWLGGLGVAYTF